MAETDQQDQGSNTPENTPEPESSSSSEQREKYIPRDRFDDVNKQKSQAERQRTQAEKRARDAEEKLRQYETQQEQQQEDRQQRQGEYQELAAKRQRKIEKLEAELNTVKGQWTEERRRNTWNKAAQGIVKPNAIPDAFLFLSDDELSNIDEGDIEGYKQLANNLIEVRDYLAADGVRGAGSGGSRIPVVGNTGSSNGQQGARNRDIIFHNPRKKRRPWK
jgi:flagellar biosynthesis GTPase FlhF